ncbi:TPA: hypothetical protein ACOA2N_003405 [Vibrio cholerae]
MKPVILTDVDGILVKWASGLPYFAQDYGINKDKILEVLTTNEFMSPGRMFNCNEKLGLKLMGEYNNSKYIKYLAGYSDAIEVINRLKSKYEFIAITALGSTDQALFNRMYNLNSLFPDAFSDVLLVNYGESKTPHYLDVKVKHSKNLLCFVDDLAHNLEDCHKVISRLPLIHMPRGERETPECDHINVLDWYDFEYNLAHLEASLNSIKEKEGK